MSTTAAPQSATAAELEALLDAPDLSKGERRELKRAVRFQRRVETWEARRAAPAPHRTHRAVITILMMLACLGVLVLLVTGPPSA